MTLVYLLWLYAGIGGRAKLPETPEEELLFGILVAVGIVLMLLLLGPIRAQMARLGRRRRTRTMPLPFDGVRPSGRGVWWWSLPRRHDPDRWASARRGMAGRPYFAGAELAGADLRGDHLAGANLEGANLAQADLAGANLESVTLAGADLSGARLCGARLERARLAGADLTGADLTGADLRDADLSRAILPGADLRRACLDGASLHDAIHDDATRWPQDFDQAGLSPMPTHTPPDRLPNSR